MANLPGTTDVLVVGAGPTGLTLAALLRTAGLDVVVAERAPRRSSEARASLLHSRGLEVLATAGAAEPVLGEGELVHAVAHHDLGLPVGEVRFDGLDGDFPFALGIGADRVEAALLGRLGELGAEVRWSTALEGLRDEGASVTAELCDRHGTTHPVQAGWVVGCDGATSAVRRLAGLAGEEVEDPGTFVLATLEVGGRLEPHAMHVYTAPEGFCALSPLPGGLQRLTATLPDGPGTPSTEELQAVLTSRGPRADPLTLGPPAWVARYRVRRGVAAAFRRGRVLLAGDAAHTFSPVGGQGMNTGLHDVANLAWKLAAVVKGTAPLRLIETYDSERRPAALRARDRTERLAGALTLGNPLARGARDALALVARAVPPLRQPLRQGLAGMDSVYAAGAYAAGAVTAGPVLEGWGEPGGRLHGLPAELVADGRHHLVLMGDELRGDTVGAAASRCRRYCDAPVLTVVGADRPGHGAQRWTADERPVPTEATGVLVRPDGHIGWTGRLDDLDGLRSHLDRWFTRSGGDGPGPGGGPRRH